MEYPFIAGVILFFIFGEIVLRIDKSPGPITFILIWTWTAARWTWWGTWIVLRLILPSETTIAAWKLRWEYARRMRSINWAGLTDAEKRGAKTDLHRWSREEMKKLLVH